MKKITASLANQKGALPLLVLVAVLGFLSFIAIASSFPLKDNLLASLYPKAASNASEGLPVEYLVKPYLVYPADKDMYPEYETSVKSYMLELQNWYKDKAGKTFVMAPLQVVRTQENYLTVRCGENPTPLCVQDPTRLDGNIGMYANKAVHQGQEQWETKTAALIFFAGAGGYAGANKYDNDAGWAITGDWVLGPISGVKNTWGIPCPDGNFYCQNGTPKGTPAHELGHAFGLPHPGAQYCNQTIMECHWNYPTAGFIPEHISMLNQSPFFNHPTGSSPTPSPSPSFVKIISPNGGETLKVGDKVTIKWEGTNRTAYYLDWSSGVGSSNQITYIGNGTTTSYDWIVNVGNLAPGSSRDIKISIDSYPSGFGTSDQSDNFFKVVAPLTNILLNSSMEQDNDGYPLNWWTRATGTRDVTVSHSGNASLKVIGPIAYTYSQQNNVLKPNTKYTYSIWIKTQNVTGRGVGIRYAQLIPSSALLTDSFTSTGGLKGTTNWTQINKTFTTPGTYVNGRADLQWELNAGDVAWFDDAALCEGANPCN